jgi:N-acetylglucosamine-6-phosphate deacetylase
VPFETLAHARVVTPQGVIGDGWVVISAGQVLEVGSGVPPQSSVVTDLGGRWLVPGFVDLHVHGGGGHDSTTSYDAMAASASFHRQHGTTRTLVSLMAQPVADLCEQLSWVAALAREGVVAGAHLEGPFLATSRCGAQNPAYLLVPDAAVLRELLDAGDGFIRTVTVAPELVDALPLISELTGSGIVAAIGHTDATYAQAMAGFHAGASLATHLFNAMGSFSQRQPGPSIAALDAGAAVELINDGVHVHEGLIRVITSRFVGQVAFITDAISATGAGDGNYTLGGRDVVVERGRALLAGSDHLAGSTLTMDLAFRRAVRVLGLPVEVAAAAASTTPARVLGLSAVCGAIEPGLAADLVVLDEELEVDRVMVSGAWIHRAP